MLQLLRVEGQEGRDRLGQQEAPQQGLRRQRAAQTGHDVRARPEQGGKRERSGPQHEVGAPARAHERPPASQHLAAAARRTARVTKVTFAQVAKKQQQKKQWKKQP